MSDQGTSGSMACMERAGSRVDDVRALVLDEVLLTRSAAGFAGNLQLTPAGTLVVEGHETRIMARTRDASEQLVLGLRGGDVHSAGVSAVNRTVNEVLAAMAIPVVASCRLALGDLRVPDAADLLGGVASACRAGGFPLVDLDLVDGGPTALSVTVFGRSVAAVAAPAAGDVLVGLPAAGIHSAGCGFVADVLLRTLMLGWDDLVPGADLSVRRALLAWHKSHQSVLFKPLRNGWIVALAHVDSGGLLGSLGGLASSDTDVVVDLGSWPLPPLFRALRHAGGLDDAALLKAINMGIGMVAVVRPERADEVRKYIGLWNEPTWVVGHIEHGARNVRMEGGFGAA